MINVNPLLKLDYPDIDVIRVDDTYYMISTTMYFMPGCEILRSYDLVNWEHATFVYDKIDSTPAEQLEGANIYGKGMWAASLRFHKGKFYVVFVCNNTHKTYLYTAENIDGPWEKSNIEGFFHDCSILFDDDDRIYIVSGNREVHLAELKSDMSGIIEGSDRIIVRDSAKAPLGYEGSHFYKINGKYYVFFIHSLEDRWFRAESCFVSDSIDGEFKGRDVFVNDIGYCGSGVAQGGIVDTPDGEWYSIMFQDRGAVGRIPVLVPMTWENDFPKMCDNIETLRNPVTKSTRPGYKYSPLYGSDIFDENGLKTYWQFNHEPDMSLVRFDNREQYWAVRTGNVVSSILEAKNTITQRLLFPRTHVEVTVDATNLNDGDCAGLAVMQSAYAYIGVKKQNGKFYKEIRERFALEGVWPPKYEERVIFEAEVDSPVQRLSYDAEFENMKDEVTFETGHKHKISFSLDHFTGNRVGLFAFSTEKSGGEAKFTDFVYK